MSNETKTYHKNVGGGTVSISGNLGRVKISKLYKKNWWLIALTWLLTILTEILASFWITGWAGVIIGTLLSVIPFWLGTKALEKVIEKKAYND